VSGGVGVWGKGGRWQGGGEGRGQPRMGVPLSSVRWQGSLLQIHVFLLAATAAAVADSHAFVPVLAAAVACTSWLCSRMPTPRS
jgi:hypothetical protein